jgi:hypothetical protein
MKLKYFLQSKGGFAMDLLKATKEQLYEIARNENYRLKERYAAAKELQRRRTNKCALSESTRQLKLDS